MRAQMEEDLANQDTLVGDLLGGTHLASNFPLAEEQFKQVLKIYRRLVALAKRGESADEGIHASNSIAALTSLGQLYSHWHKEHDALEAYQTALDCMRDTVSVHGSTHRQQTLANVLALQGEVHNDQYERQG